MRQCDLEVDMAIHAAVGWMVLNPEKPVPNEQMFLIAWFMELKKRWPNVTLEEAKKWLQECVYDLAAFGAKGHDWSYTAAIEQVRECVDQFGETS